MPMTSIPDTICRIFCNNFKRYYLKNGRLFLDFLFHFWNVHEISNILKKRMSVLALSFSNLLFRKEVVTETSRRSCFRTPFDNQRVNGFQTPLKVRRHHYYPSFRWIYGKLSWKKTALLWSKILRLFANTFPAMTSIQAAICRIFGNNFKRYYLKNGRFFLDFFFHFWNVDQIYNIFEKRMSVLA